MNPIFLLYGRSNPRCPWCEKAKALLTERQIPFETVDLAFDTPERKLGFERMKAERWGTIPAIFELTPDGEIKGFIGGYEKLVAELENRI